MLKQAVAIAGLALALTGILPAAGADAQERFWKRRPLSEFGTNFTNRLKEPFLRRRLAPLPNYFFENRSAIFGPRRPVGHNELANALRARGFKDVGAIQQRGSTFITEATGPSGERVRLVINGITGGIDGVRVIGKGS
jgi:hypothetical protein